MSKKLNLFKSNNHIRIFFIEFNSCIHWYRQIDIRERIVQASLFKFTELILILGSLLYVSNETRCLNTFSRIGISTFRRSALFAGSIRNQRIIVTRKLVFASRRTAANGITSVLTLTKGSLISMGRIPFAGDCAGSFVGVCPLLVPPCRGNSQFKGTTGSTCVCPCMCKKVRGVAYKCSFKCSP